MNILQRIFRKINKKNSYRFILEFIPAVAIITISILILPVSGVQVNNNSAKYLQQANSIMQGQETEMIFPEFETTRGPVFPMILVSAFRLIGKTVLSASLATRAFFSLGIILIYLLGRVLYGRTVGILASFLAITSFGLNRIAVSIDSDIVLPFFILLCILFYYLSLNRYSLSWAVLAGISLGLALLVKESAFLCLGLPLVMAIIAPRVKRYDYLKIGLWLIAATITTLIPWLIKTVINYGSLLPALGVAHPNILQYSAKTAGFDSPFAYWAYLFTVGLKNAFIEYYNAHIHAVSPLSSVMVAGCIILFIKGLVFKKNRDLVLTISVFCFLPLILRVADTQVRLGQTTMIFMLLYVILAASVVFVVNFSTRHIFKFTNKIFQIDKLPIKINYSQKYVHFILILFVGLFFISFQLFLGKNPTWKTWNKGQYSLKIFSKQKFRVYGRFTTEQQDAAIWLKNNTPKDTKILTDGFTHEALDFFYVRDYNIPIFRFKEIVVDISKEITIDLENIIKEYEKIKPIFVITYHSFDSGNNRTRILWVFYEKDITAGMKKQQPDYLVISTRQLFLQHYFNHAHWAELKYKNPRVVIYKINTDKINKVTMNKLYVNDTINTHIDWLKTSFPKEYNRFVHIIEKLGISVADLKKTENRIPFGEVF